MKAVVFAAGLGTRLHPLTQDKPKALVEVAGKTMLEHTLTKLYLAGIREVVVNVHAFADKVEHWLVAWAVRYPDMKVKVSDERTLLLETGGGLKKMRPYLEGSLFLVHNVDVLSDIRLTDLMKADTAYASMGNPNQPHLATLAVRQAASDRYFLFNKDGLLCGWENVRTGEQKLTGKLDEPLTRYAFTGIHIIHPCLFDGMTETGVFSITDVFLRLAATHAIRFFDVTPYRWYDIGTPEQRRTAELAWLQQAPR
jgi:NDP-sugar pyrophosphorylase family protein